MKPIISPLYRVSWDGGRFVCPFSPSFSRQQQSYASRASEPQPDVANHLCSRRPGLRRESIQCPDRWPLLTGTISFFVNTFLLGATLRATDSRFKEPTGGHRFPFKVSLLSLSGLLNNTNNNHGDHCIFAMTNDPTRPPTDTGNQVLDDSRCRPFFEPVSTAVVGFPVVAQL